nr:hypothetical protein [Nonlabens ulvanivorans]
MKIAIMMLVQEMIIERFRESVPKTKSVIQHLADVLEISYDAAYRRIQGKAKLDIEESMKLAKVGQFSLDQIMTAQQDLTALGTATDTINSIESLEKYFKDMETNLKAAGKEDVEWIYSAKDIPVFHHFNDSLLGRFKIYVWLHLLDDTMEGKRFADFHLPLSIKEQIKINKSLFEQFKRVEIWNDTTISSSLQQIHFYHEAGYIDHDTAKVLCNDLRELLKKTATDLMHDSYNIYYHELLLMSNNAVVRKKSVAVAGFVTMTMLGYIRFSGSNILNRMNDFFKHQIRQSTSIKDCSLKERSIFYNKMEQKINALEKISRALQFISHS